MSDWTMPKNQYFKVLGPNRQPFHGGSGQWPESGAWTSERNPDPCRSGWHLCRCDDLIGWLGPHIWIAEAAGGTVEAQDKVVTSRARLLYECETWNETTARLFAADCAERVLPIFERMRPDDDRPRKVIEAARSFARGEIGAAAWDAARAAAWGAAWAAARAAAGDAARAAAWAAAGDAAGDAARAAAWAAARAAAWDAAGDAARAAAWAAEREWQTDRLMQYLTGALS